MSRGHYRVGAEIAAEPPKPFPIVAVAVVLGGIAAVAAVLRDEARTAKEGKW